MKEKHNKQQQSELGDLNRQDAVERHFARDDLPKHDAERVDIDAMIVVAQAVGTQHLRRRIGHCSHLPHRHRQSPCVDPTTATRDTETEVSRNERVYLQKVNRINCVLVRSSTSSASPRIAPIQSPKSSPCQNKSQKKTRRKTLARIHITHPKPSSRSTFCGFRSR